MASSELLTNKNYIDFVERYAFDLVKFAVEVCGMTPTWQQIELLQSVQPSGSRTTVRSGHGTGKSRSIAVIVLWHLLCYPDSNTLITAPKIEQVRNVAWKRDLLDEMTRLPYHFDEKARYVIEKKEEMRKQGIHSPDIFDAISFLFLENITFMLSEKSENNKVLNSTENALLNAEKMFEDIF